MEQVSFKSYIAGFFFHTYTVYKNDKKKETKVNIYLRCVLK